MWQCPKCKRVFKRKNQSHYCDEKPTTIDEYIARKEKEIQESEEYKSYKKLKDEMVILIYTKEEIANFENGNSLELPIETCVCPEIKNDGCLHEEDVVSNKNEEEATVAEGPHVISILTATKEEWMLLPGIGETKANAIIEYRNTHGFQSIEDVKNVKGIGDSTFEKIKEYLTM